MAHLFIANVPPIIIFLAPSDSELEQQPKTNSLLI
jgi:hypothetical protein